MRLAISLALILAAATAPRQGCGNGGTAPTYDPCAGKACGDACTVCPPDAKDCFETAVVKACDPFHHCVPEVAGMCTAQGVCAGKACGERCTIDPPCRLASPPCMMPSVLGYCSGGTECIPEPPPCPTQPPAWGCVGKACGDSCGYCPSGQDPATCPVPTFAPTACDAQLQCVLADQLACSPQAACLGKACGAPCDTCPACVGPGPAAMSCDASGSCVAGAPTCPP